MARILAIAGLLAAAAATAAQTAPAGWTSKTASGILTLTPGDVPTGQTFEVAIYPRRPMDSGGVDGFLKAFKDPQAPGVLSCTPEVKANSANVASMTATYKIDGKPTIAIYFAISIDQSQVRTMRLLTDGPTLIKQYQPAVSQIISDLTATEKKAAENDGRGTAIEKLPTAPPGMTPGGKIVQGIYAGTQLYGNEIRARYRLYLYENGEFQLCDDKGEPVRFGDGEVTYDPRTGKLEVGITFDLNNDRSDPEDDKCLYGKDQNGKPMVYGRSDHGFSYVTTVLRYAGPVDKPSPHALEEAKRREEEERNSYKFVTKPGQGLSLTQLAGLYHHGDVKTAGDGGTSYDEEVFVVLKDGTVYSGLPCPRDMWDVPTSKRREPEKWGKWHAGKTGALLVAWPSAPNSFTPLKAYKVLPGNAGERLEGKYGAGSTTGSLISISGSSYSLRYVTFTKDGRFETESRGGFSSGLTVQTMSGTSINTYHDDEGSVSSADTPGAFVASSSKKKNAPSRSGTYHIEGYSIVLRYDDGRVIKQPFFLEGADRKSVWFGEETKSKS
jgi:hypothetical protein